MAKSKIKGYWGNDKNNISCLILERKRGKITYIDAYEWLEENGYKGYSFVMLVEVASDMVPMELYDEGDTWLLYEPYDIWNEIKKLALE